MAKSKILRVPCELDNMINRLALDISKETGQPTSKGYAMRKLAEIDHKIVYKNNKIDWRLF